MTYFCKGISTGQTRNMGMLAHFEKVIILSKYIKSKDFWLVNSIFLMGHWNLPGAICSPKGIFHRLQPKVQKSWTLVAAFVAACDLPVATFLLWCGKGNLIGQSVDALTFLFVRYHFPLVVGYTLWNWMHKGMDWALQNGLQLERQISTQPFPKQPFSTCYRSPFLELASFQPSIVPSIVHQSVFNWRLWSAIFGRLILSEWSFQVDWFYVIILTSFLQFRFWASSLSWRLPPKCAHFAWHLHHSSFC